MAKANKKANKPKQNENKAAEELDEKITEALAENEETEEEAAEEAEAEESEEVSAENAEESEEAEVEESEEDEESEENEEKEEKSGIIVPPPVSEEEAKENEEFRKLPFVEKCKKDPMIPVSIILAILALIVAGIYFLLPNAKTPSMGLTLDEFISRFNEGEVAKSLMNSGFDITFRTPDYVDISSNPSILGDKEVVKAKSAYADFFEGPFKYYNIGGIEGATRKNDGKLAYTRVYIQYGEEDFNTVWLYSSNVICALYPDLTMYQAMDISMKAMGEYNGDARYYVKGDYAFRLVAVKKAADGGGELVYIVVDCVPKAALKADQIREDLGPTLPPSATAESASETVSESVTATT